MLYKNCIVCIQLSRVLTIAMSLVEKMRPHQQKFNTKMLNAVVN